MKVKELLTDASKWTQKAYKRDANGDGECAEELAVCWCLEGALRHCYDHCYNRYDVGFVHSRARCHLLNYCKIEHGVDHIIWNDLPTTAFEQVKALVNELDI